MARASSPLRILAVSGSLRARSSNTEILRAAALLAPPTVEVVPYSGLAALPHFNPDLDLEGATPPQEVGALRRAVARADALLISCPEYAHGVPGTLKNALDWLVSFAEVAGMPVGLLNASPRSSHAQASLAETLRTMAMTVVPEASITLPLPGPAPDAAVMVRDPALGEALRRALGALVRAATERQGDRRDRGSRRGDGASGR